MLEFFMAGWVILAVVCEVHISKVVKASDGDTSWPDDDSKAMAKQYAEYDNDANTAKKRAIRVTYLAVPALAAFIIFVM